MPSEGFSNPASNLNKVVFPSPLRPTNPTVSPN